LDPVSPEDTPLNPLCRSVSGGVVDREPSKLHVDPLTSKRDPLGFEKPALTRALCQRTVGAHDALPGDVGVIACRHHRAGESGRGGTQVAVGGDEAGGNRPGTPQHLTRAGGVEHPFSIRAFPAGRLPAQQGWLRGFGVGRLGARRLGIGRDPPLRLLLRLEHRHRDDDRRHHEAGPDEERQVVSAGQR